MYLKAKHYLSQIYLPDSSSILNLKPNNEIEKCIKEMLTYSYENFRRDIILQSYLYKFIYLLTQNICGIKHISKEAASELLTNSNFTVGHIARSVEYRDVLLFSKIFKKLLVLHLLNLETKLKF